MMVVFSHLSPNDPTGPVNLLGPLSAAGPYSGLFTGTRWKPFPEVPPTISYLSKLPSATVTENGVIKCIILSVNHHHHQQVPQCKRMDHTTSQRVKSTFCSKRNRFLIQLWKINIFSGCESAWENIKGTRWLNWKQILFFLCASLHVAQTNVTMTEIILIF